MKNDRTSNDDQLGFTFNSLNFILRRHYLFLFTYLLNDFNHCLFVLGILTPQRHLGLIEKDVYYFSNTNNSYRTENLVS